MLDRRDAAVSEERPHGGRRRSRSCCSARCSPRCRSSASARPSTCSRWPGWPSPSARLPTPRSSSSRTARRSCRMRGAVSRAERQEIDHPLDRARSTQAAAVLAADHPGVVPAGLLPGGARSAAVRSAGLQQDVRDGVLDAADAVPAAARSSSGSSSATRSRAAGLPGERGRQGVPVGARGRRSATATRSPAPACSSLIPAAVLLRGFQKDFLPEIDEGSILYMPTTLPGLPNRGGRLDPPADGQEAEGVSGGRARVRQDRPGGHVDRSGAADDDRDDGAAAAEVEVARRA